MILRFSPPPFRLVLLPVLACSAGLIIPRLSGQTVAPRSVAPTGKATLQLEKFVTTGSRFNDRTVTDSPVPVDVITGAELTQGGYHETAQMLQAAIPSFNFPRPSLADGTDHIRPATLRGLAPDQTLVLINGKRRHTSALVNLNNSIGRGSVSTDFNAIPPAALERVEVLRDGASAQYGSDAIAGVINLILRQTPGWGLELSGGRTKAGDGTDRKLDAWTGLQLGAGGSLFVNLWTRDHDATNRIDPDTRQQYFGDGGTAAISGNYGSGTGLSAPNGTPDPREAGSHRLNHRFGDPESRDKGLWFNGELPFQGVTGYFFGGTSIRHANSAGFFRRPGDDRTVRAIWPDGFLPMITTVVTDQSLGGGFKGRTSGWNWDLSTVYGRNKLEYGTFNTVNVTLGNASPTRFRNGTLAFDQWTTNLDLAGEYAPGGFNRPLKVAVGAEHRREHYLIRAGEPDSYRNGGVPILTGPAAGAAAAVGSQVFPGFKPGDAGRHGREAVSLYADLEQEITDRWLVSLAGRFEDYSDFGTEATVKLATRVKVSGPFSLRGSASTGFRAPHLAQSWYSATATNFINGVGYEILTFPASNPAARALGASDLRPETSRNLSLGATWNPLPDLSASIDFYRIAIEERIALSSNFTGAPVIDLLTAQGFTGIGGGRYFTNAADTVTQGVDATLRYAWPTGRWGRFTFTAGFNHNKTRAVHVRAAPANLAAVTTTPLFDLTETIRLEKGQPRDTANLSTHWEARGISSHVRLVRYGEVSLVAFTNATAAQVAALTPGYRTTLAPAVPATVGGTTTNHQIIQTFGAKWVTDLDVSRRITEHLRISIGASNLFDIHPDENIRSTVAGGIPYNGNDNFGAFPYNGISPFGFNGAFYYMRLSLKF